MFSKRLLTIGDQKSEQKKNLCKSKTLNTAPTEWQIYGQNFVQRIISRLQFEICGYRTNRDNNSLNCKNSFRIARWKYECSPLHPGSWSIQPGGCGLAFTQRQCSLRIYWYKSTIIHISFHSREKWLAAIKLTKPFVRTLWSRLFTVLVVLFCCRYYVHIEWKSRSATIHLHKFAHMNTHTNENCIYGGNNSSAYVICERSTRCQRKKAVIGIHERFAY